MAMADVMVKTGLRDAGYTYVLLDDGWPECLVKDREGNCLAPGLRDANHRIIPSPDKFPFGIKNVSDYVHKLGMKFGIYTAPHRATCGGFTASLGYELIDAQTFVDWGIDFVKLDAGCQDDCSIHDSCLLHSITLFKNALNQTGRTVLVYVDDGNPTSGPKVYIPFRRSWPNDSFTRTHVATKWSEFVASWGPSHANMWKIWFDRTDDWHSLYENVHQQVGMQWFQACNGFFFPDFMTIGQGGMTQGQYRAEVFLYTVLAAPMILSFNLTTMDAFTSNLLLNPELLEVNGDKDCVMATLVRDFYSEEIWIKPLHDGSFAVVFVNKDPFSDRQITLNLGHPDGSSTDEDFYPAGPFKSVQIRNLYTRQDEGKFSGLFSRKITAMDAAIYRVYPLD